jgi:hypothetical protein
MEIRPNKRWLQSRRKELLVADASSNHAELTAVEYGIKAMRTVRGAAAFRKQLKAGILMIGSTAGGTGGPMPPGLSVTAEPRK